MSYPAGPPPLVLAAVSFPVLLCRRRRRSSPPASLLLHCRSSSFAPAPWKRRTSRIAAAMEEEEDDDLFTVDLDLESEDDDGDGSPSPWEGALVYRRDAAVQHLEYATTLERLGLGDLSSPDSRSRAAAMGILSSTKADQTETPVLVSVDDPVEEPDVIDLGTIYEEDDIAKGPSQDEEDDQDIDWDERLHFPAAHKEIDISKHIRDLIHLEITFDAFCSPTCKGLCLVCGTNLNTTSCSCSCSTDKPLQPKDAKPRGPLKELLRPLQQR
ncbi:hypothetical protein PR202_ga03486 [Eleusine coracana subsp. coracana]|uniref:Uncharacterized protein n=1 Tax=Eleusine coracana subsp. coracana TaxID=191504 RepID=A0AAV5BPZ0_ELECO|nr:hypothetical protein PR202_ga03486 [Eleusine coracana subsp. coracana]